MKKISDGAQNFACYLIDKCEGETITEESILRWLGKMADEPQYNPSASIADTAGAIEGRKCFRCGHDAHLGSCVNVAPADTAGAKPVLVRKGRTAKDDIYASMSAAGAKPWIKHIDAEGNPYWLQHAPPAPSVADAAGASAKMEFKPVGSNEHMIVHGTPEVIDALKERLTHDYRLAAGVSEGQAVLPFSMCLDDVIVMWNATKGDSFEDQLMELAVAAINFYKDTAPDPRDAEIAALRERIAGMEKDAERYRWLKVNAHIELLMDPNPVAFFECDERIDAALAKEPK